MSYQEVLTALADPTRRGIFESLREQPQSVGEIACAQTVSRPAVSKHLKVLSQAGLVTIRPAGNRNIYAIQADGLQELRLYLDTFWTDVLSDLRTRVKEELE